MQVQKGSLDKEQSISKTKINKVLCGQHNAGSRGSMTILGNVGSNFPYVTKSDERPHLEDMKKQYKYVVCSTYNRTDFITKQPLVRAK